MVFWSQKKKRLRNFIPAIYPSSLFACNIYSVHQQRLLSASDEQIDEYSVCTGRLGRTTDDVLCASELHHIIGSLPYVDTITYLRLQLQHLMRRDKNTQLELLNLHGCSKKKWVDYRMCVMTWQSRQWSMVQMFFFYLICNSTYWTYWGHVRPL